MTSNYCLKTLWPRIAEAFNVDLQAFRRQLDAQELAQRIFILHKVIFQFYGCWFCCLLLLLWLLLLLLLFVPFSFIWHPEQLEEDLGLPGASQRLRQGALVSHRKQHKQQNNNNDNDNDNNNSTKKDLFQTTQNRKIRNPVR
ncbi:unnamed protein product [Polarella glacialis]|uniref:Uncharacterized protein n=1 Tax=Polarella glacialis TaxID=89957 RepID=A0A813K378_POLGL|nr:unnamed protein product [Polarella glacialis]